MTPALASSTASLTARLTPEARARVQETAQKFESFFLTQMVEHMWSGVEPDAMFGGGQGEAVYRSMLNERYAESIARRGGIGIADAVMREMVRLMETQGK